MKRNIILGILFCFVTWIGGFFYYLYYINSYKLNFSTTTDAIVVFAGGENRVNTAVALLKKSYATILFITNISSTQQLANFLKENKVSKEQVIYGIGGSDITEAAQKTAEFISRNRIKSIRLVTANYNMPRSLSKVTSVISEAGIAIIPHPTFPAENNYFTIFKEYNKYLLSSLL